MHSRMWATTMALEIRSAARTNTATPSSTPTRRGRAVRGRKASCSAAFLALLARHAQGRLREGLQARLPYRLAAGFAYSI